MLEQAVLPYAGTSGWSGSTTSKERAQRDDSAGVTRNRQSLVMQTLEHAGPKGLTWKEFGDLTGCHHGTASGALSVLHKEGHIARLNERRNSCLVYVLPEHVNGRVTGEQGRKKKCAHCGGEQ